jgi:hypothetical protein
MLYFKTTVMPDDPQLTLMVTVTILLSEQDCFAAPKPY